MCFECGGIKAPTTTRTGDTKACINEQARKYCASSIDYLALCPFNTSMIMLILISAMINRFIFSGNNSN
jgi:hypothetical protein